MDEKDIFSRDTDVNQINSQPPRMIPKWATAVTVIVLIIAVMISGIFIGMNINGVNSNVKQMSKKLPALAEIYDLIDKYYYKDINWDEVQDKTIAGMLALDEFSGVSIMEYGAPQPKMGITFKLSVYNDTFVHYVAKNSPASIALGTEKDVTINYKDRYFVVKDTSDTSKNIRIERGDQIIGARPIGASFDYAYLLGLDYSAVQNILLSANDLDLLFVKPNDTYYSINISKAFFEDETPISEYYNMADLSGNQAHKNIGYVNLTEYDDYNIDQFLASLIKFKNDANANKLILDLRDNGGGDVQMVQKMAPYLMDITMNSPIMQLVDKKGNTDTLKPISYNYDNKKPEFIGKNKTNYEIVVLTNGNTASASEATLGLLRYYEKSTYVIGTPTYGKGVAQSVISNVAGKYTVSIVSAYFNVPYSGDASGWKNFHGEGMVPDYNFNDQDKFNKDYGKLHANLIDEIDVIKAIEYLTK